MGHRRGLEGQETAAEGEEVEPEVEGVGQRRAAGKAAVNKEDQLVLQLIIMQI